MAAAEQPVVFGQSFEGLRRALGPHFDDAFRAAIAPLGVRYEKLQVAYPLATWLATLELASRRLSPEADQQVRYRDVGRHFVRGFTQGGVGFAVVAMGRALGPKRMLQRMGRNFQTGTNYLETTFVELGPTTVEVCTFVNARFKPQMGPGTLAYASFRQGILEESLAILKVRSHVELTGADDDRQDFTYRVTW